LTAIAAVPAGVASLFGGGFDALQLGIAPSIVSAAAPSLLSSG